MASGTEDSSLTPEQTAKVLALGRSAPRQRRQDGHVCKEGKRPVKWKGHFFQYETLPDGTEKRHHRKVDLGPVTESTKKAAKEKLRSTIAIALNVVLPPEPDMTLRRFWDERFRPLKEPTWKPSARSRLVFNIEHYILIPFGSVPLAKIDRFALQLHLNGLASKFSHSICHKFRTNTKAILDEALEQDLITKNPARKLDLPETRNICRRFLSTEEISELIAAAPPRDRLIIRMFLVLGLRPGELFALRRNDVDVNRLRVDESDSGRLGLVRPKTNSSDTFVWMPDQLAAEVKAWMELMEDRRPEVFLFASKRGTTIDYSNFLHRNIQNGAVKTALKRREEAKMETPTGYLTGVNHQAFRRTCATWAQEEGTVKDVQAMLRHSSPNMTANTYMQAIDENVKRAVTALDGKLRSIVHNCSQV